MLVEDEGPDVLGKPLTSLRRTVAVRATRPITINYMIQDLMQKTLKKIKRKKLPLI